MRFRHWLIALLAALAALSVTAGSPAKKNVDKNKVVTRVHFSGNMEGELDPCG